MKKKIVIEVETNVYGDRCDTACIGLCGYYCDIFNERVENRNRLKRCRDAEVYKSNTDKNDDR